MTEPDFPERVKQLRALYDTLPKLKCKGLCANGCRTRIDMSATEWSRLNILVEAPTWMRRVEGRVCPVLQRGKHCGAYGVRPMICRLWGLTQNPGLRCHHGCEPERWLTDVEALEFLFRSFEIGGAPDGVGPGDLDKAREMMRDPGVASTLALFLAGQSDRRPSREDEL